MNIIVSYSGIYPPIKGASGGDRRVREIVRGLCQDGNIVKMYVPIWHNIGQKNNDENEYSIVYLGSKYFNRIPILNRMLFWHKVVKQSKRDKANAFLFYGPLIDCIIPTIRLNRNKIVTSLELCDLQSSNYPLSILKSPRGALVRWGEFYMPKFTKINFVISKYLEDFIKLSAPQTPIVTIPILVDHTLFQPSEQMRRNFRVDYSISEDEILIAYIGGMWKIEGVDYLIESFSLLKKKHKKVKLLIAGRLDKEEDCTDVLGLIEKYDLSNDVITTGWVGTDVVSQILNAADILTVPQVDSEFNKAGLPTKLAEYSSSGKAIVVSDIGDVNIYFKNMKSAILTQPSNLESLTDALDLLIVNKDLRDELGANASSVAKEQFNYKANGKKMLECYKKLVKSN